MRPAAAARLAVPPAVLARIRDGVCVVAGNGPSLAAIAPGRVLAQDAILRTNSFFLETAYHLGTRVDLAMISGDPRVAPFLVETLSGLAGQYRLESWTSNDPRVIRIAARRLTAPQVPLAFADADTTAEVARLCDHYRAQPTAGGADAAAGPCAGGAAHPLGGHRPVCRAATLCL